MTEIFLNINMGSFKLLYLIPLISMNIKAVYAGSYSGTGECTYIRDKLPALKTDSSKIILKIRALNQKQGERNKLKTAYGNWFVTQSKGWAYAVCCSENYPERHAYGLIASIKTEAEKGDATDFKFLKHLHKFIEEKAPKYEDVTKIDKVSQAQNQVNLLQKELSQGLKKMVGGREALDDLDDKATEMRNLSRQFQVKSTKLQSVTFWQKWKLILIIISAVIGFMAMSAIVVLVRT